MVSHRLIARQVVGSQTRPTFTIGERPKQGEGSPCAIMQALVEGLAEPLPGWLTLG